MQVWSKLPFHGFGSWERHSAFCVAKDWLQDTGEAVFVHHQRGFCKDPYLAYIEFWGVLQAVYIQQDALSEMHFAVTDEEIKADKMGGDGWAKIRDFRNKAVGHPTRKDHGKDNRVFKTVTGRQAKSYDRITMMIEIDGKRTHPTINLEQMLDDYDREGAKILRVMFDKLRSLISNAGSPEEV